MQIFIKSVVYCVVYCPICFFYYCFRHILLLHCQIIIRPVLTKLAVAAVFQSISVYHFKVTSIFVGFPIAITVPILKKKAKVEKPL